MYLRISLTDRCNLRCTYCLPERAAFADQHASDDELIVLSRLIALAVPIHKIRLTGGEPTLCGRLFDHVRNAAELVPVVGMTSNGVLLSPLIPGLVQAGLNRINISLDAIDTASFRRVARRDGLDRVIDAIRTATVAGFTSVKVNAVAMQGTDYAGLVRLATWLGVHLRFIELMHIGEARAFHAAEFTTADEMRCRIAAAGISLVERTDLDEPTSRVWAIDGHDPATCSVGFITTVTQPFCATCDRLRLSSQGRLFTCLMDDIGTDLLGPLRAGDRDDVIARVRAAVARKAPPAVSTRQAVMAGIGG
jgi:cyclic pyranopterin phosphate synthase